MSLYLVTGGAGFIGSNIVSELLRRSEKVRVLDNLSTGRRENLAGQHGVEFIEGDIRDARACVEACRGVDFVIHQAAFISVPASIEDPAGASEINVIGTINMMDAAARAGAKKFVYASSCAVYGNAGQEALREESAGAMLSPYAATKFSDEIFAETFMNCFGLAAVGLRYFNVFGPRQDPHSPYAAVIPLFISQALSGKPPTINGDGTQTRDFVFVEDVARANLLACASALPRHEVFNIGSGHSISVNTLAETVIEIVGSTLAPLHGPDRPGDIRHSRADVSKASRLLGFDASVSLREGLARTVAWTKKAFS